MVGPHMNAQIPCLCGETEGRRGVGDDGKGSGESGVGEGVELWGGEFGVDGDVCWVGDFVGFHGMGD